MVVKYEDLKTNTVAEVKKILKFLQVPYTDEKIHSIINKGFSEFQRHGPHNTSEHYTREQRHFVQQVLISTLKLLYERKLLDVCNIVDYYEDS